jgi:TonB family protein
MIAAFGFFGLTACNSDDYKTSDNSHQSDTSQYKTDATAAGNTADGNTAKDNSAAANGSSTASTGKTAGGGTAVAKKRKASIVWSENSQEKMVKDAEGVYNRTDVMPQFPGGQNGLSSYVNDHLEYPQQAIDDNTVGTVKVSFVVDEHGKVMKAKLVDGQKIGSGLDEQALRVVSSMPAWKPGKVNGKAVKTRLELPISFQLEA